MTPYRVLKYGFEGPYQYEDGHSKARKAVKCFRRRISVGEIGKFGNPSVYTVPELGHHPNNQQLAHDYRRGGDTRDIVLHLIRPPTFYEH